MYQGLMTNFLNRAAWKKSSYHGRGILPGQFGTVLSRLAESLGVPRSTLQRMVTHLEEDGFLEVENVGNRFSIITITNWHIYQMSEGDAWATGGQPVVNQRATGGQPSYKEEEVKKEEEYISPSPRACVDDPESPTQAPTRGEAARLFKTVQGVFVEVWPEAAHTAVTHTDEMLTHLAEHLKADPQRAGPGFWRTAAKRSRASAFLRREVPGKNGKCFPGMRFGWFLKPDTIGKISNGDFDDAPTPRSRDAPPQVDPEDYDPVKSF